MGRLYTVVSRPPGRRASVRSHAARHFRDADTERRPLGLSGSAAAAWARRRRRAIVAYPECCQAWTFRYTLPALRCPRGELFSGARRDLAGIARARSGAFRAGCPARRATLVAYDSTRREETLVLNGHPNLGCRIRSEPDVHAHATHDRRVHTLQAVAIVAERLLQPGVDHLEVEAHPQPLGDRGVVEHLDRVLLVEAEVEPLAQERNELVAELGARPADPEVVVRTPRDYPVAPDSGRIAVLDRARIPVGGAEVEEHPDAALRVTGGLPEVLVEAVEHATRCCPRGSRAAPG